jgi:hypothetical protein
MWQVSFPASECAFGTCVTNCCRDGCRVCYEDVVDLAPFMAEVAEEHGLRKAGFDIACIGQSGEPGYERNRGFIRSSRASGCAFQDTATGGCLLHAAALSRDLPWRRMKPFTCVLYPVRMSHIEHTSGPALVLQPSREHSICESLTHLKKNPRSTRSYLEAKIEDIRFLFDLGEG